MIDAFERILKCALCPTRVSKYEFVPFVCQMVSAQEADIVFSFESDACLRSMFIANKELKSPEFVCILNLLLE